MTNEELNTALYEKMFAEQQRYREWLLSQPPDEILNHCYEFTVSRHGAWRLSIPPLKKSVKLNVRRAVLPL